MALAKENT